MYPRPINRYFPGRCGGDVNYRQGIYDGDNLIAVLDMSTLDEPMQALMVFSKIEKPVLLRHLKLTPDGKPLVEAVPLYWKTGNVIANIIDGIAATGNGTDRLTVVFTTKDTFGMMKVERTLTVTYDESLGSYIYDFKDRAVVNFPESLDHNTPVSFEICDPWFTDCPAPSQPFPGMWKGRYSKYAYESKSGEVLGIPHNHYSSPYKANVELKPDGIFSAVYEPDGNPAFQFMGETAGKIKIGICPWGYDVHFGYKVESAELYNPMTAHFRIFQLPKDKAMAMNKNAVISPLKPTDFNGVSEFPMYEPLSSFEKGVAIVTPHQGEIDPWFWVPQDEKGAVWDRTFGRTGNSSLKIEKDTPGIATWYSPVRGSGIFHRALDTL